MMLITNLKVKLTKHTLKILWCEQRKILNSVGSILDTSTLFGCKGESYRQWLFNFFFETNIKDA